MGRRGKAWPWGIWSESEDDGEGMGRKEKAWGERVGHGDDRERVKKVERE